MYVRSPQYILPTTAWTWPDCFHVRLPEMQCVHVSRKFRTRKYRELNRQERVEGLNGSQKRAKWVPGETKRNVYEYFHDYGVESRNPGPAPAGEAHANTSRESWFLKRYRSRGG